MVVQLTHKDHAYRFSKNSVSLLSCPPRRSLVDVLVHEARVLAEVRHLTVFEPADADRCAARA